MLLLGVDYATVMLLVSGTLIIFHVKLVMIVWELLTLNMTQSSFVFLVICLMASRGVSLKLLIVVGVGFILCRVGLVDMMVQSRLIGVLGLVKNAITLSFFNEFLIGSYGYIK